ncbi:hypothetical protein LZ32DRAFT_428273 [Colletotrichum eremochloae]|nr:hypothetical protein LZ32DRAFT_428273 [Colletotrichum eremochloae]
MRIGQLGTMILLSMLLDTQADILCTTRSGYDHETITDTLQSKIVILASLKIGVMLPCRTAVLVLLIHSRLSKTFVPMRRRMIP